MMLSDIDIYSSLMQGKLEIEPYEMGCLQPASYDVHLSNDFIVPLGLKQPERYICSEVELEPMQFLLGSTLEKVKIPNNLVARIEGKSSLARLGLMVHITAGFIDPGFCGNITLELLNVNSVPITLIAGMRIAQISFERLQTPCIYPYGSQELNSRYQNSEGTIESRLKNSEKE